MVQTAQNSARIGGADAVVAHHAGPSPALADRSRDDMADQKSIPFGYCQCGCGGLAPIAPATRLDRNEIKGHPRKFIFGHRAWPIEASRAGNLLLQKRALATRDSRFWTRVDRRTSAACWPFLGRRNTYGYGMFSSMSKQMYASRFAWIITRGPVPNGLVVCHRCDNPPCCNPDHLFLGTSADNVADMIAKGRHRGGGVRGAAHHAAVLTEEIVRAIRERVSAGLRTCDIAKEFGLRWGTVDHVVKRRSWKDVV